MKTCVEGAGVKWWSYLQRRSSTQRWICSSIVSQSGPPVSTPLTHTLWSSEHGSLLPLSHLLPLLCPPPHTASLLLPQQGNHQQPGCSAREDGHHMWTVTQQSFIMLPFSLPCAAADAPTRFHGGKWEFQAWKPCAARQGEG